METVVKVGESHLSSKEEKCKMKAIVKTGEHLGFSYMEVDKPTPKPNEVLIDVEATNICGTDISYFKWGQSAKDFASKFNVKFPFIVGHECAGTVVEVGSDVKKIKVGDRVSLETHIPCGDCFQCKTGNAHNCMNMGIYGTSCDGCFADYAIAPESVCFKLPDSVSFQEGSLFEPAGVAMRAVELSGLEPGDTGLIFGCGAIGLLAIQILQACGVSRVIAVDIDQYRVDMAKKFGAIGVNSLTEDLPTVVKELTAERGGVDFIFEMTGSPKVYETLFDFLRLEGRVVTVGHPGGSIPINITQSINLKGATIKGLFGRGIWSTWYKLSALVEAKKINILDVVTHRFSFSQVDEAFEQLKQGSGKIMFLKDK
ncbi:alcohol dehydrogenase catalytic domain-containing protein [Neobacillus drentensis]|uniref:zinc-dependent alcohol dehydrogenase n=1 Tax=Neobacillus TaxID=2675232 RepID=UPI002FFE68CF